MGPKGSLLGGPNPNLVCTAATSKPSGLLSKESVRHYAGQALDWAKQPLHWPVIFLGMARRVVGGLLGRASRSTVAELLARLP